MFKLIYQQEKTWFSQILNFFIPEISMGPVPRIPTTLWHCLKKGA